MTWDIEIHKEIGGLAGRRRDHRRFALDIQFRSDARRLVLFGSSGAGKTLTLKAMAGLMRPDRGHVRIDGEVLLDTDSHIDVPARQRHMAYLFQEYALFPHLTVQQNVAFGLYLGWRNPPRSSQHQAVQRWLLAFELDTLAGRYPHELSGGQRQRTALARALVAQPKAMLLDEPFAALDAPLRKKLREELLQLQRELGTPMVLITHDPADVDAFADEVVHIDAGRTVPAIE